MKKATVYLLLFLYTAVQLKPLTVVLQDAMAHTFFKMQHMATVHYENGRYHVHKELKEINDQEQAPQKTSSSTKVIETSWQLAITDLHFDFTPTVTVIPFYFSPMNIFTKGLHYRHFARQHWHNHQLVIQR